MGIVFSCSLKQGKEQIPVSSHCEFFLFISDQLLTAKFLSQENIRISIYNPSSSNLELSKIFQRYHSHLAVIIDADCMNSETLLQECTKYECFYDTFHWLVFGSAVNITEKFEDVELVINADVTIAVDYNETGNWAILDLYNPSRKDGGKVIVQEIGYYNDEEGYNVSCFGDKYFVRKNMTGITFKTVFVIPEKNNLSLKEYSEYDGDRNINTFSRFQVRVFENCQNFYNYSTDDMVLSSWGYQQPNGDVDGMLKELKEKRIDFGSAPLMLKEYRLKLVDYGLGTWIMRSAFVFRHPKNTASSYELYLRPLQGIVWIFTIATTILITIILRLIVTNEMKFLNKTRTNKKDERSWSFLMIYSIGEFCQQGFSYIPTMASGKILVMTVLIFFFLIYQFYSASIVSFLLLEPKKSINILADLLNSHLQVGCENSPYDQDYITTTTDPVAIQLYQKKIKGPDNTSNFLSAIDGLGRVKKGGFAFHTTISTGYPVILNEFPEKVICELAEVQMYPEQTLHAVFLKRSPLKEMFNYCMYHQLEVGVLKRLRKHWVAPKPQCIDHTRYLKIEVGLDESYWALVLLKQIEINKYLMERNIRVSMFNVENRTFNLTEVLKKTHYHIGVVIDIDCNNVESFLIECADNRFFYDTYSWLVFASNESAILQFEDVGLAINADLSVAVPNSDLNWTIFDVYNPSQKRGGDLKVEEIGYYSEDEGYNTKLVWNKYYKRRNMTGTTFTAAMVIVDNITTSLDDYLQSEEQRNNNTFSRFNSVTVHLCQDFYNFSMDKSILKSWGYVQDDGDVDGLVRALKYSEVDFGIAALLYKDFRLVVIDYGFGNWIMKSAFMFRHPTSTSSSYEIYLQPLEDIVWICIIVAMVLMIIVLRFVIQRELKLLDASGQTTNVGESNWSFLIIYNIGELCQQGFSYIPVLASGRITVLTVLVFFFLIYQFYSASIVAFLLLPPRKTIKTLTDLLRSSLGAGIENILYDIDYLMTTTDPVAIALYHKKIQRPHNKTNFLPPHDGLELVKAGGFAFHTQISTGYPIIKDTFTEEVICELAEVQLYKPIRAHMPLARKSPLREMFMYCNVYQREVGILDRLRKFWDAPKPQCIDHTPYLKVEVGLHDSYWALLLLGVGMGTSLTFLMLEILWKRWSKIIFGKK
ncbi:hypothetical protein FQA39_LY04960 [Lamprigera yunnana]|nr:hypothetical protein FQA39_LY04960 [Lamprigera yunnana]